VNDSELTDGKHSQNLIFSQFLSELNLYLLIVILTFTCFLKMHFLLILRFCDAFW
jgi:hypothetical protein